MAFAEVFAVALLAPGLVEAAERVTATTFRYWTVDRNEPDPEGAVAQSGGVWYNLQTRSQEKRDGVALLSDW